MAKAHRGSRRRPSREGPPGGVGREHWRADGQPKTRFPSRDEANRSALRLRLEAGADLDPYRCGFCGGWHLGNRSDRP
ncbi:MAG TPA: hypothetical protein VGY51_13815 [Acidimicrobiales bacterium]|nr:hypothetical protein [Acidimicrobiales bacterium]